MKTTALLLLIPLVFAQNEFGNSYLKNSVLCKPWSCINEHLGLPDNLPGKDEFLAKLTSILPTDWHGVAKNVVSVCYGVKPRSYTNTCPGQALLHCVVDNLVNKCPEQSLRKSDACTPITSIAGLKYMFSQSRYADLQRNLPIDRRPTWFLKNQCSSQQMFPIIHHSFELNSWGMLNYFSSKCCTIPELVNKTVLSKCGFIDIIHYYIHDPKPKQAIHKRPEPLKEFFEKHQEDPLDCCDLNDFFPKQSREKCLFETFWDGPNRLSIKNKVPGFRSAPVMKPFAGITRTLGAVQYDVKVVPLSCEIETCIFRNLNIITENNTIDEAAFIKLLDSLTADHPEWHSAKARVVTTCLARQRQGYNEGCDINALLACTFDVLTENCPRISEPAIDPCKHTRTTLNGIHCQISTSKYRPRNRRLFCPFPELVSKAVLSKCGALSIGKLENVTSISRDNSLHQNLYRKFSWLSMPSPCKDTFPSTSCAMSEIGVLNKYNFMDYFKMKQRIREFISKNSEWEPFENILLGFYSTTPLYNEHCTSQRKMLNVIDALMMTCPISKRKDTPMCNKMFMDIVKNAPSPPENTTPKYYHHHNSIPGDHKTEAKKQNLGKKLPPIAKLFDSKAAPPVEIISIKPQIMQKHKRKPLTMLPVYLQQKKNIEKKENPRPIIVEPPSTHLEPKLRPMKPGFAPQIPYGIVDYTERPLLFGSPPFSPYLSDSFMTASKQVQLELGEDENHID